MFSERKILKKMKKSTAMKEAEKIDHDKEGRAVIDLGLVDSDEFFHPYSYKTYDLVRPEVIQCIEMFESQIPAKEELSINIHTEEQTDNFDKKRIRNAMKRHYAEKIVTLNKKMKKDILFATILILFGIVFSVVECVLWARWSQQFVDLILSIIAWTFIWDGFETFIVDLPLNRRTQLKNYRIMNAKVHVRKYSKKIQKDYGIGEYEDEED